MPFCECGCGLEVNWHRGRPNRFIVGHATRGLPRTPEWRQKVRVALRDYNADGGHLIAYHYQTGPDHPDWKGGVRWDVYTRIAIEAHGTACQRCGRDDDTIQTHHRDLDHYNADPSNLERLCPSCHMQHHRGKRMDWVCPVCGTVLTLQPYWATRRRYCSMACRMTTRRKDGTLG